MPKFLIVTRFSIMLILYLVRYLLSKCFKLLQGKFPHSKQNFALPFRKIAQFLILHRTRVTGLSVSVPLQPGHLFFSLTYAIQMPQFIPQGAIRKHLFNSFVIDHYFLFASAAPTAILIAGITRYLNPICAK